MSFVSPATSLPRHAEAEKALAAVADVDVVVLLLMVAADRSGLTIDCRAAIVGM
jgi:hypothetical protein